MKKFFKIAIPEPCHEDWNIMTPNEKGRFCSACDKTVVDFTKLSTMQIQDFLYENQHQSICGHIKNTQLDAIHLSIPLNIIHRSHSFRKKFLLALLVAMGSTLFSCTNTEGKPQKIDTVKIVPSLKQKTDQITSSNHTPLLCGTTSLPKKKDNDSLFYYEQGFVTMGEIAPPTIEGDIIVTEVDPKEGISFRDLEIPPSFPDTKDDERTKDTFSNLLKETIAAEFNSGIGKKEGLTGTQRIYAMFEINTKGKVQNIKTRSSHPALSKETKRVLEQLPVFNPGTYKNQVVITKYILPIVFKIEK